MKPVYDRDGISIYHGDCREILPALEAADLILADIPYGVVTRDDSGLRSLDRGVADVVTFPLSFAIEQSSRLADSVYIWCGTEQLSELRAGFVASGMTTRIGIWEKSNPSPMNGELFWLSAIETCIFARKSKAYFAEFCKPPVWRGPIEDKPIHPTQKPEWLFKRLIHASCPVGVTVIDFCVGSGTTLRAAKDMGRKAIGIEREDKYIGPMIDRMAQKVLQFK